MRVGAVWIWALAITVSTAFGVYFGYRQIEVVAASGMVKVGTLGVLSWAAAPQFETCEPSDVEEVLACYASYVRGSMSPIRVPIETETSVWRRLSKEFDVYNARRGLLPLPTVYSIDFGEKSGVLSIETRGRSDAEAVKLAREVLDQLIADHKNRAEQHRSFLLNLAARIEGFQNSDVNDISASEVTPTAKLAIVASVTLASELTRPTDYIVMPKPLPRGMNAMWLRVFSGLIVGIILGGVIFLLRRAGSEQ